MSHTEQREAIKLVAIERNPSSGSKRPSKAVDIERVREIHPDDGDRERTKNHQDGGGSERA